MQTHFKKNQFEQRLDDRFEVKPFYEYESIALHDIKVRTSSPLNLVTRHCVNDFEWFCDKNGGVSGVKQHFFG